MSERETKTQRWRKKGERREKEDEKEEKTWEKKKFFKNTSGVIATIKKYSDIVRSDPFRSPEQLSSKEPQEDRNVSF